jgi:hypothetical protein
MASSHRPAPHTLPPDIRHQLAKIELEYQQGELTQRGYELRRSRVLSPVDVAALAQAIDGNTRLNTSAVVACPVECVDR